MKGGFKSFSRGSIPREKVGGFIAGSSNGPSEAGRQDIATFRFWWRKHLFLCKIGESSNGRTEASEAFNRGPNPCSPVTATTSATTTQSLATDFINISFGVAGASLRQHYYRWRNDDGNETAASWAQTEDTALASGVFPGDRRRLRVSVSNANAASSNITYRLEYASGASCDSGWTPVPSAATTEHWVMDPSYYLSEEAVTTAALSVPPGKTFASGFAKQASNQTSAHNLTASQYSEFEYAIKSSANAVTGTNYCFRLTNAGTALNTYFVTPQITFFELRNSFTLENQRHAKQPQR